MKGPAKQYLLNKQQLYRIISMCGAVERRQLNALFDIDNSILETMITQFITTGRIVKNGTHIAVDEEKLKNPDREMIAALWVLTDFFEKTEYYTAGEFPAQLCFFADGVEYEIIYAEDERETIINKAIDHNEESPRRIVIIENTDQIEKITINNIAAYCVVSDSGKVKYYRKGTS